MTNMATEIEELIAGKECKPLTEKKHKSLQDRKFRRRLRFIKHITVEPIVAGFIILSLISRFAMTNLNYDKACKVHLRLSREICEALVRKDSKNYTSYEEQVQKLIASIDIWKSFIYTIVPCIIIIFLGGWSDRTGKRKLCILLPLCGELATSINHLFNVYFFYEIPVQVAMIVETSLLALSGGWLTMFLGVFSYISDITSEESRTFRVGLVSICLTAGFPIGIGVSGILVQIMGYYGIFSMTATIFTTLFFYGFFYLKEPEDLLKKKGLTSIKRPGKENVSFFDISHVIDTIVVAFRKRSNNRRTKLLLTLFLVFVLFGPLMSEYFILYMFVRNRLNWDMVKFSVYTSYAKILMSFGSVFAVTVLCRKLQIHDYLLCLISVGCKFISSAWTAFVKTDIEMYFIPVTEMLNATIFTSLRSILTKLVEKHEMAKVNSLFSLAETLASLIFHPFYSWLYMETLQVLSGAVFLTSAALIIPAACILTTFYIQHRIQLQNTRRNTMKAEERKKEDEKTSQRSFMPE